MIGHRGFHASLYATDTFPSDHGSKIPVPIVHFTYREPTSLVPIRYWDPREQVGASSTYKYKVVAGLSSEHNLINRKAIQFARTDGMLKRPSSTETPQKRG